MKRFNIKLIFIFINVCVFLFSIQNNIAFAEFKEQISAKYCCMIDSETMRIVYEKNAHTRHSMASTTKIMTALLAVEKCGMDEIVTVSRNASYQEGSSLYLKEGNKIRMIDLLYGLMLNSGNDAAVAVAEHISGSVEKFADEMNKKALEIGAYDTHFQNPNGLDADGHYSTAYDMALIGGYAMNNETIAQIVGTRQYSTALIDDSIKLYFKNHNKLLTRYKYANGIKTGYTKATGRCLVSSANINGMKFIVCTLDAPDDWNDHEKLYKYAENNFERRLIVKKGQRLKEYDICGERVEAVSGSDIYASCEKGKRFEGNLNVSINENLSLPLKKFDEIGVCYIDTLKNNNSLSERYLVLSGNDVEKRKVRVSFWEKIIKKFKRGQ